MGLPGVRNDQRFLTKANRAQHAQEIGGIFGPLFEEKPKEHWIEFLEGCDVPCGPVNNVREVVAAPRVQAREMIIEMDHPKVGKIKMAGSPIKSSLTPVCFRCPPPLLGKDTDMILSQLGYSREEIDSFKTEGVI